jgi:predicted methyltransferase
VFPADSIEVIEKRTKGMNVNWLALGFLLVSIASAASVFGQEKSVKPGINDSFRDPKVDEFVDRFEVESREVYAKREEIVKALQITPGSTIADVGAGTGLFTQIFAKEVGEKGNVIAVDIAQNFLDHIAASCKEKKLHNVVGILCTPEDSKLPENSVDAVYICDTYHHFEFPLKTMQSIHTAMRPGAKLFVIDFIRIEGKSSDWTINHVRAGQEVFEKEILSCGFKKIDERPELLKENYFLVFEKAKQQVALPLDGGR